MKEKSPESLAGRFSHWGFQRSALGRLDLPSPLLATPSHDDDGDDEDVVVDVVDDGDHGDHGDEIFSSTLQHLYMMMVRMMMMMLMINTLYFHLNITSLMMTKIRRTEDNEKGEEGLI